MFLSHNLQYNYPGGLLLHYPDLTLHAGQSCLISGRSGSGKSTLLYLMAGLLSPKEGSIKLKAQDYNQLSGRQASEFRAKNIGIIWQDMHFMPALNLMENLEAYALFLGMNYERNQIHEFAERLGITEFLDKSVYRLSRGEQQRVSVARALLNNPSLVLADEPTSSLDDDNCKLAMELMLEQCSAACLIIASHDHRIKGLTTKEINL